MKKWTETNALYQVYPRSFMDTNGNGVGDLQGVIDKLDHIKGAPGSLGIDAIWLSPFYPSPQADCGYDVSDYCDVDPLFGDIETFQRLLDEAHRRDIKVLIDFVPNHTSDQHEWFRESRSSRDNPKRDWYVWRDPKDDGSEPNNWLSMAGGKSWTLDEATGQYYLHSFMREQPDLNWKNPDVREAMTNAMQFWLDKGVDGFRIDAIWVLSKDEGLPDDPLNPDFHAEGDHYGNFIHSSCKDGPELFKYLRVMTDTVAEYDNRFIVFENYPDDKLGKVSDQYRRFYELDQRVSAPFYFEGMHLPWSDESARQFLRDFMQLIKPGDVPIFCFGNHDQSRLAQRFGREKARLIALMQMSLPGMPTVYYGEEIGMQDVDIEAQWLKDKFQDHNAMGGRDPERTPMQWNDAEKAGFTTGEPWLPLADDYRDYNVEKQNDDPGSFLALYKNLIALRNRDDTMIRGTLQLLDCGNKPVVVYERSSEQSRYMIVLNFADSEQEVFVSYTASIVCSTNPDSLPRISGSGEVKLRPFEGIIARLS